MCLDSALDLWPPGHFALEFFATQIGRSEMECSALGFSYVRWKPRNKQLAKMRSFRLSKRSDNKQYAVEVRWGIFFLRIWRIFLFLRTVVNIPLQNLIAQDDHLTAGAWVACGNNNSITTLRGLQRVFAWRVTAPKFVGWRVIEPKLSAWRGTGHHNLMRDFLFYKWFTWLTNQISVIVNALWPRGNQSLKVNRVLQRSINHGSRHTVFWSFPSFADLRPTLDVFDLIGRSKQSQHNMRKLM